MDWLQDLGVTQYEGAFSEFGLKNLGDTLLLSEEEWIKLGVKSFHRKKILNGALKESGKHWLDVCGFPQYKDAFEEFGVDNCADVLMLEDDDWKELKVKPFHKKKIVNFGKLWSSEGEEEKEKEERERKEREEKERKEKEVKEKKEREEKEKKEREEKEKKEKEEKEKKEREEKERKEREEKEKAAASSREDDDSIGTLSDRSEKGEKKRDIDSRRKKEEANKKQKKDDPSTAKPAASPKKAAASSSAIQQQQQQQQGTSAPSLALASKQPNPHVHDRLSKRLSVSPNVNGLY